MGNLNSVIEKIYSSLACGNTPVYREYEKIPVREHEDIYVTAGISEISVDNISSLNSGRIYKEKYSLRVRIIGSRDNMPQKLYDVLDSQIFSGLLSAEFFIEHARISEPYQDKGLRRLVLECTAEITGRMEAVYEP